MGKVKDFFYASSACVYNEAKQEDPANPGLVEADAWPARPQDMYGLEKLYAEEMALAYGRDFGINIRIACFIIFMVHVEHGRVVERRFLPPFAAKRSQVLRNSKYGE